MIVEGVTFIEHEIRKMSKSDFIRIHMPVFWQDRNESDRRKMLSDTYDLIVGEKKEKK